MRKHILNCREVLIKSRVWYLLLVINTICFCGRLLMFYKIIYDLSYRDSGFVTRLLVFTRFSCHICKCTQKTFGNILLLTNIIYCVFVVFNLQ